MARMRLFVACWAVPSCVAVGCSSNPAANDQHESLDSGPLDGSQPQDDAGDHFGDGDADGDGGHHGPLACADDAWPMFGHDAARSSASGGCVVGALAREWQYSPPPDDRVVFAAVAQRDAVFLNWRTQTNATTAIDRVSSDGVVEWGWGSGGNANIGYWPAVGLGSVIIENDGLYYLDAVTGNRTFASSVDWWGQLAIDGDSVYVSQVIHVHGDPVHVGAYRSDGTNRWRQNAFGQCPVDVADQMGGLAVANGSVFYAPRYTSVLASGLYAFDASTGALQWHHDTTPESLVSADADKLFLAENGQLVARAQDNGEIMWSMPVSGPAEQPPVLAVGLAVFADESGVLAMDAATGNEVWRVPVPGAALPKWIFTEEGGCRGGLNFGAGERSTMAAALGSRTLLVTGSDAVYVLSLTDGSVVWQGVPRGVSNRLINPIIVERRVYAIDGLFVIAMEAG